VRSPSQTKPSPINAPPRSPLATTHQPIEESNEEDDDKARRSGIAARMAKLGGIKFGMPPPVFRKPTAGSDDPTSPGPRDDAPMSPQEEAPAQSPNEERLQPSSASEQQDETPENEAERRRTTLARLRAGGALGFGMFNHGPKAEEDRQDTRGLLEEPEVEAPSAPSEQPTPVNAPTEDEDAPPPPPGRPPVPSGRPSIPIPVPQAEDDEASPPPPPSRPTRQSTSEVPMSPISPIRSPSGNRPPIPALDRRISVQLSPTREKQSMDQSRDRNMTDEPAGIVSQDEAPPPPNRPVPSPSPIQTQYIPPQSPTHSRSPSIASRMSYKSRLSTDGFSPVARQNSVGVSVPPMQQEQARTATPEMAPRASTSTQQGGRPAYDALVAASKDSGARLARAARAMFDQGKKAYYGVSYPFDRVHELTKRMEAHMDSC